MRASGMAYRSFWQTLRGIVVATAAGALCVASATSSTSAADEAKLWAALKAGDAFVIMRHALAPGTGDPSSFDVADCSTQRNLDGRGRAQAQQIGRRFRENGIASADVYSSQWCRCQETARLLGLGDVKPLPPLNSFFEAMDRRAAQTRATKQWLIAYKGRGPLVLVSHQVNISALTGLPTSSGEMVFASIGPSGKVNVLGSLD